jgi:hypothetical protein
MKLSRAEVKTLTNLFYDIGGQFSWHDSHQMGHVSFPHLSSKEEMVGMAKKIERKLTPELAGKLSVYLRPGMLDLVCGSLPLWVLRGIGYNNPEQIV